MSSNRCRRLNRREIRVFAMQRSGHHAIIEWIAAHFAGIVHFKNNVSYIDKARPREYELLGDCPSAAQRNLYVFNVEEADLRSVEDSIARNVWSTKDGESRRVDQVLVIRDAYNLFASRLRHPSQSICRIGPESIALWKQHAREYLRITCLLQAGAIPVFYNEWHQSAAYRLEVERALSLNSCPAAEVQRTRTSRWGGGSSFDGPQFDKGAERMETLKRWKELRLASKYRHLVLDDSEVKDLMKQLCGVERFELEFADRD